MTRKRMREIKKLWIAALTSGEYKQTKGKLRKKRKDGSYGYCCLGVLCEVTGETNKLGRRSGTLDSSLHPEAVDFLEGLGLFRDGAIPEVSEYDDGVSALMYANDGNCQGTPRKNFDEIADLIRKYGKVG